jgi:hypothetical protein
MAKISLQAFSALDPFLTKDKGKKWLIICFNWGEPILHPLSKHERNLAAGRKRPGAALVT